MTTYKTNGEESKEIGIYKGDGQEPSEVPCVIYPSSTLTNKLEALRGVMNLFENMSQEELRRLERGDSFTKGIPGQ